MADQTETLLAELQKLDDREDLILDVLLRHGAALEEAERRMNLVSVADLGPLRDGLTALEQTIDKVQADVSRAEASSTPPVPSAPAPAVPTNGGDTVLNGSDAPASPPLTTMTELAARIREQDTQAAQIREVLRDRLLALGATSDPATPAPQVDDSPVEVPGPVPVTPRTFKLLGSPMHGSDVAAFQHELNLRFKAWGINFRVSENGVYNKETRLAARRILLGLGVDLQDAKGGITPHLALMIRKPSLRTPEQRIEAQKNRPWLRKFKASVAGDKPKPPGAVKPPQTGKPGARPAGSMQAAIRAHGGRYEDIVIREAKRHHLPISLVCAILEKESGFRNIYGHDGVANPIKSPPKGVKAVTEANYAQYLKHRKAGRGAQGVGPMQLTFPPFQDRADALGGCWKVDANIRAGCEALAGEIKRLGSTRQGIRAYNGTGKDAEAYAADVIKRQAVWHSRLKGKPAGHPPPKPGGGKPSGTKRRRTFKVTSHTHGKDVRAWQKRLRAQFRTWGVDYPIAADGHYGPVTRTATLDVLYGLGIARSTMRHGVSPELRIKVRNKELTARQRVRYRARAHWRRRLRKRFARKGVAPPLNKILQSSWGYHRGVHDGVDLICQANAPIMALCDAEVIDVRGGGWWGKAPGSSGGHPVSAGDGIIQLRCLTDRGPFRKGMHFGYGHAEHAVVRKGQKVKAGELIGRAGFANAWHVHFMANGGATTRGVGDRDPMPFVNYAMKRGH